MSKIFSFLLIEIIKLLKLCFLKLSIIFKIMGLPLYGTKGFWQNVSKWFHSSSSASCHD